MKDITNEFDRVYEPVKALLIYQCTVEEEYNNRSVYIESYDIGIKGKPINAHPLSAKEMLALSELLAQAKELKTDFLQCRGIMPSNVLQVDTTMMGRAVWFTPPQEVNLYFAASLTIPSGRAFVPAMVWKADREHLYVYALKGSRKPVLDTPLYHAPFFNIYHDGKVCMGTVGIDINSNTRLEDFISQWEEYFWNSYFSHLIADFSPVEVNIVQLWQSQVNGKSAFPVNVLRPRGEKLKKLLL